MRSTLEPMVLQILALTNHADPRLFDFIQQPPPQALWSACDRLVDLEAVKRVGDDFVTTSLGKILAALPVEAVLGKMLVWAASIGQVGVINKIVIICASISVQHPFSRGLNASNRDSLYSEEGDPFTLMNLLSEWSRVKCEGGSTRIWARKYGVDEHRVYEVVKLIGQFHNVLSTYLGVRNAVKRDRNHNEAERVLKRRKKSGRRQKFLLFDDSGDENDMEDTAGFSEILRFRFGGHVDQRIGIYYWKRLESPISLRRHFRIEKK